MTLLALFKKQISQCDHNVCTCDCSCAPCSTGTDCPPTCATGSSSTAITHTCADGVEVTCYSDCTPSPVTPVGCQYIGCCFTADGQNHWNYIFLGSQSMVLCDPSVTVYRTAVFPAYTYDSGPPAYDASWDESDPVWPGQPQYDPRYFNYHRLVYNLTGGTNTIVDNGTADCTQGYTALGTITEEIYNYGSLSTTFTFNITALYNTTNGFPSGSIKFGGDPYQATSFSDPVTCNCCASGWTEYTGGHCCPPSFTYSSDTGNCVWTG